ncbi:DUF2971 domain-containing protein [Pelagicoccus sp. SDUM812005]|uniref:DUF2971 domain-containing protein n=1 Tax=Pelagicoccus sp. SDUM812005 TaxID=3041257 RepID=UPI00280DE076|nr:DUF2971 domain-containing protein [Pelagicoccus sp. SDUM812005]MDQ8182581.1 DUF2971 domain-containing protein [Pelagicoccus sp. SDUM812005]
MRVYHFLNEEFGLKDLLEKRIKISNLLDLNDPFEFGNIVFTKSSEKNSLRISMEIVASYTGVLCFSRNWKNPVQWSHYADRHKGICLGFEIKDELLEEVHYTHQRIVLDKKVSEEEITRRNLVTKYIDWKYEEEYRTFINLGQKEDGYHFAYFDDGLKLAEVIIGCRSSVSEDKIRELTKPLGDITISKAFTSETNFEVLKTEIK